ncbi:MAG TPA: nucleotidyltransferase [Rhodospirillaceae bacterium]|nr:MAG: hypothetical protein A2018_01265 [Alphaproteobacteria bacterium GWF2_58_20]HAU29787.1 nucleotidyltransferase [Rhodospirillaceae bacterium]
MGVGEDFRSFCGNLAVTVARRSCISDRCQMITRRLNLEFWGSDSPTNHSIYAGSYGRGTATGVTSDVDMIFWLPPAIYTKYNSYLGNGQSALLQAFKNALQKTYSTTHIGADGQVVVVAFWDGITFEIVPAFEMLDSSFKYPDTNDGGTWKNTNPRPEIAEINRMDQECNGNLKNLCKMARAWKMEWGVPIGGFLIDTLAYKFIIDYAHRDKSFLYYDLVSRDFFDYLAGQSSSQNVWLSPGSNQHVVRAGLFEYKALQCKNIAIDACGYQGDKYGWTARQLWRKIYGTKYPT